MRIHHLDCVSSCPLGGLLMDGKSKSLRGKLACHCLLVEDGRIWCSWTPATACVTSPRLARD